MSDYQEQMRILIETHCSTLRDEAAMVQDCLDGLGDMSDDPRLIVAEGVGYAHHIKGSSGTIGFGDISEIAKSLEHHLRAMDQLDKPPTLEDIEVARELSKKLSDAVATLKPEQSTLYEAA